MTELSPDQLNVVNEQLMDAMYNFVRDNCQIADNTIVELYGDDATVLAKVEIDGDDGVTRMWHVKIDLDDESHEVISERDFTGEADEMTDLEAAIIDICIDFS